ncbi:hypothetical protein DRQ36_08815 [bacterium]|nr:MAG: hypothetical protein DRQ36_08815 [bacterium]
MNHYLLVPIGFAAGILAGYLGIGGGGIFVPVLFFCFSGLCSAELVPKLSVGTSTGAVLLTGLSGAFRHWQLGHIDLSFFLRISAGALVGAFFGGLVVCHLPADILRIVIGIVLFIAAFRMVTYAKRDDSSFNERKPWWLVPIGVVVGLIAATVGIGGGILAVPILAGILGLNTKRAAGTSAAMTVVLSVGAIVGHILWGQGVPGRPPGSFGFVVIADSLILGIPAAAGAAIGAGLHRKFEPNIFRVVFALLLVAVGIKIIFF